MTGPNFKLELKPNFSHDFDLLFGSIFTDDVAEDSIPTLNLLAFYEMVDGSLVDSIGITGTEDVYCWGDSLTLGCAEYLRPYHGIVNKGIGGETSDEIEARFYPPLKSDDIEIIWAGSNNRHEQTQILSDVASMVARSGSRYLVVGLLMNAVHLTGSASNTATLELNSALSSIYGSKYFDALAYLLTQYDSEVPQDILDVDNNITPSTLRADDIHLNSTGYTLLAGEIHDKLVSLGYLPDPAKHMKLYGVTGNCLTSSGTEGLYLNIKVPDGSPAISTVAKIENGGTATLTYIGTVAERLSVKSNGTIFNLRLTFTDGSVCVFPCNEGGGTVLYGYRISDGAVFIAHIGANTAYGGTISSIWAGTQDIYHHGARYGTGRVLADEYGPEILFRPGERDFSQASIWTLGTGWALSNGKAVHSGTVGSTLTNSGISVQGASMLCTFDIPDFTATLIGLSGGTLTGGYYINGVNSYSKAYTTLDYSLSFYSNKDGNSVDNVSLRSVYQANARIPANPINGKDLRGNDLYQQRGFNDSAKYALPPTTALLAADDGTFFDVSDQQIAKTLTELLALQGGQYFFTIAKGLAIYDAVQVDPALTKIGRYFGFS